MAPLERSARVLADAKPKDAKPWTTILLLGTDEGPGNFGARTDTIILVAVQHGTGRAAAFGIPRNLAQVPLGRKRKLSKEPLNAIYGLNGGGAEGASALKQAVSNLLGIRVDYYALVNLLGFADLVDALGGVEIEVKERLVDEVTRPAWGERKPRIDVVPGRTYRFYGREALAYVRSRKDSSDYTRMARQRCFLSALADQLDPVRVLRNFGSLAKTVETNVHTDIPLNRLPSLVRLVSSVEPKQTMTVTFSFDYFFGRAEGRQLPGAEARDDARDGAGRDPHAGAAAAAGDGEDREADLLNLRRCDRASHHDVSRYPTKLAAYKVTHAAMAMRHNLRRRQRVDAARTRASAKSGTR